MASNSRNHRAIETHGDWIRDQEKRLGNEERRRNISSASDVMGPGLGPQAVAIENWNAEETGFNGVFYSSGDANAVPRAQIAPNTNGWIGTSWVDPEGFGYQEVTNYRQTGGLPIEKWGRQFLNIGGSSVFQPWQQII